MTSPKDRLAKAINRAYDYFPFRFEALLRMEEWVIGPAFIVKAPDFEPTVEYFLHRDDHEEIKSKARSMLEHPPLVVVDVAAKGHTVPRFDKYGQQVGEPKCTGRYYYVADQIEGELAWPFVSLGKACGVKVWRADGTQVVGLNEKGELMLVCAGRTPCNKHVA